MHAEKLNPPTDCFIAGELLTCVKLVTSTTYTFGYLTEKVNLSGLPFHQEVEWITCCHVGQVGIKNLGIFFLHPTPFFFTHPIFFEWKINFTSPSLTLKCQIRIENLSVWIIHVFFHFSSQILSFSSLQSVVVFINPCVLVIGVCLHFAMAFVSRCEFCCLYFFFMYWTYADTDCQSVRFIRINNPYESYGFSIRIVLTD